MNFMMWLAVGVIVGRLASVFGGTRDGIFLDIIVGIIGAGVAGLLVTPFLGISPINQNPFNLLAMVVAVGGAVIGLAILSILRQRGYRLS